jgi:5-methylthioadenosine/S-adenosylhomocysteine deaminase
VAFLVNPFRSKNVRSIVNGQPVNVEWVFVDGRALKRGGQLVDVHPEAIVQAAQEVANRIKQFLFP